VRPVVVTLYGQEGLVAPAMDYLLDLGIPAEDIKRVQLDAPNGDVQTVTVTLLVRKRLDDDGEHCPVHGDGVPACTCPPGGVQ
jgi:hypothetical protein